MPSAPALVASLPSEREAALSEFMGSCSAHPTSAAAFAARHPVGTARAARHLLALPTVEYVPGRSEEARIVARELTRHASRRLLLGLTSALRIPERPGEYRLGASRQTLRRKVRSAEREGVTWVRVDDPAERQSLLRLADLHERLTAREAYRSPEPDLADLLAVELWLLARSASGAPLLLSVTPIDGDWASLRYFRTLETSEPATLARYAMTEVLVEELGARGVRHLIDGAMPHWLPNGLRHFQRMVGFRLVRVRIRLRGPGNIPAAVHDGAHIGSMSTVH